MNGGAYMKYSVEDEMFVVRDDTGASTYVMGLDVIASWRELLGLASDADAVNAIMQAKDPGVIDKETSRNAWTSAYEQVQHDIASDYNQVSAAIMKPLTATGSLCADGCNEARNQLGLESSPLPVQMMSLMAFTSEPEGASLKAPIDDSLSSALAEHADEIQEYADKFRDSINPIKMKENK